MVQVRLQLVDGPEVKKTVQFSNILSLQEFIWNNRIYHELSSKGLDDSNWDKKSEGEPVLQIFFNEGAGDAEGDKITNAFNSQTMAMKRDNDLPFNFNFIKHLSTSTFLTLLKIIPFYQRQVFDGETVILSQKDFANFLTIEPPTGKYQEFSSSGEKSGELPSYMVTLLRLFIHLSSMEEWERDQFCKDIDPVINKLGKGS